MTTQELTTLPPHDLTAALGQAANGHAAKSAFARYQERKAPNTLRAQRAALDLFGKFLTRAADKLDMTTDPATWEDRYNLVGNPHSWVGVTWGLVEAFTAWMIQHGYAMGSVGCRLSAVKTYAKLACKAGTLSAAELAMIRSVEGYSQSEGDRVDDKRDVTRIGSKKAEPVSLTPAQVKRLKRQPNTPQGRRDALIIALLADHGLRVGELRGLQVTDIDVETGTMIFFRPKVNLIQKHDLTPDAKRALAAYFGAGDAPAMGPLLRGSSTTGGIHLTGAGMSERSISERVRTLGTDVGAVGLSAHDLRHYWATQAARNKTPLDRLMQAGGWKSSAMPLHYIEREEIANLGVMLE